MMKKNSKVRRSDAGTGHAVFLFWDRYRLFSAIFESDDYGGYRSTRYPLVQILECDRSRRLDALLPITAFIL